MSTITVNCKIKMGLIKDLKDGHYFPEAVMENWIFTVLNFCRLRICLVLWLWFFPSLMVAHCCSMLFFHSHIWALLFFFLPLSRTLRIILDLIGWPMIIYFKVFFLATIITWVILISVSQEGEHIGCIHGLNMNSLWGREMEPILPSRVIYRF